MVLPQQRRAMTGKINDPRSIRAEGPDTKTTRKTNSASLIVTGVNSRKSAAVQAGKITDGYVVLAHRSTVVKSKPVAAVVALLEVFEPRDGRFGLCWWVRDDLTPDGVNEFPF